MTIHTIYPDEPLTSTQRMKEMKQLTKDPNAAAKARAAEKRANEEAGLKSINIALPTSTTSAKKKPVFKSTLQPEHAADVDSKPAAKLDASDENSDPSGAVRNGWYEERYQPGFATGCDDQDCEVCKDGVIDLGPGDREVTMQD